MAAKKKKAGRPKGSKNVKKKVAKKGKRGRPKGAKNVKKKAKKKAGRPKAAKRRASTKTRTVTISASLADKIEGLTLLGKGDSIEKAIDKLIK